MFMVIVSVLILVFWINFIVLFGLVSSWLWLSLFFVLWLFFLLFMLVFSEFRILSLFFIEILLRWVILVMVLVMLILYF